MADENQPDLLTELYDACVFVSFDKQRQLDRIHGDAAEWSFSMDTGLLTFGGGSSYQCQLLGSESTLSNTWLWAWANASGVPEGLLGIATQMHDAGEKFQIPELTERKLPMETGGGHFFSLIACGLFGAKAYYRGDYENGAAFLVITDERFPPSNEDPITRIQAVVPRAMGYRAISNHRLALEKYLEYLGLAGEAAGRNILVKRDEKTVEAVFDEQNRLTELKVKA